MRLDKDLMNDTGQISLDYIVGVSIFIVSFFFLYSTLNSLFLPFQFSSNELQPMAERASVLLVESADWLAIDSSSPNIIDNLTVSRVNDSLSPSEYDTTRSKLGLDTTNLDYKLNVSLRYFNNTIYPNANNPSKPLLLGGQIPDNTAKTGQVTRYVYLKKDTEQNSTRLMLSVKVWI
jgi:hypothetical protein